MNNQEFYNLLDQAGHRLGNLAKNNPAYEFELHKLIEIIGNKYKEDCPVIDLKHTAYDALVDAAMSSNWIPEEYTANDWLYDCCEFLRNGNKDKEPVAWMHKETGKLLKYYPVPIGTKDMWIPLYAD